MTPRPSGRQHNEMRQISVEPHVNAFAEGSCIINVGRTKVHCTASIQHGVPRWMKAQNKKGGWITAEYGMLPRSTHDRMDRGATKGKQSGRTLEISRLIGRALRSVVNMEKMGARTFWLDCDVIQADGGTRTAAITGAYIALRMALDSLVEQGKLAENPMTDYLAAISCGVTESGAVLDLDYDEDCNAIADGNFVMTGSSGVVEVQTTAEGGTISIAEMNQMTKLAEKGIKDLIGMQKSVMQAL